MEQTVDPLTRIVKQLTEMFHVEHFPKKPVFTGGTRLLIDFDLALKQSKPLTPTAETILLDARGARACGEQFKQISGESFRTCR